jgi:hypothetical protein
MLSSRVALLAGARLMAGRSARVPCVSSGRLSLLAFNGRAGSAQCAKFSTAPPPQEAPQDKSKTTALQEFDYDNHDDYEEPTTAKGWVAMYTRTALHLTFLAAVAYCFAVAAVELFPGPTGPNNMYNRAFDLVRTNADVQSMTGENMSAYGRSVGRRHIDSRTYTHEDGTERTRIRFNVMGKRGRAMVWAEMSNHMGDMDEFAYLIVQDRRSGRILTLHDNRAALDALPPRELGMLETATKYVKGTFSSGSQSA